VAGIVYGASFGYPAKTWRQQLALLMVALALTAAPNEPMPKTPGAIGFGAGQAEDQPVAEFLEDLAAAAEGLAAEAPGDDLLGLLRALAAKPELLGEEVASVSQGVGKACREIARGLREDRTAAIIAAPLDPARLAAIRDAAEELAFSRETAEPPVSLFGRVETVAGEQPVHFCVPVREQRARLTAPLFERPVANEAKWWRKTMRDCIALEVLRAVLSGAGDRTVAESPEAWRDAVVAWRARAHSSEDGPPVLLFGKDWPWHDESDLAAAIAERLRGGRPGDVVLARTPFLDGFTIARSPLQSPTILAPAGLFRSLAFGTGPDGHVLAATFHPDEADPATGVLTVSGSLSIDLDRPHRALVIEARRRDDDGPA
jgi:hypothetical protein